MYYIVYTYICNVLYYVLYELKFQQNSRGTFLTFFMNMKLQFESNLEANLTDVSASLKLASWFGKYRRQLAVDIDCMTCFLFYIFDSTVMFYSILIIFHDN